LVESPYDSEDILQALLERGLTPLWLIFSPGQFGRALEVCDVLEPWMERPGEVLSANDVMAYCRRSLANYRIPRWVEFLDTELPKSGSGKVLKRILRDCYWAHRERAVN
jgi:acyl-CoA synthetase (AMP-forming)/AMP-acid ligase II